MALSILRCPGQSILIGESIVVTLVHKPEERFPWSIDVSSSKPIIVKRLGDVLIIDNEILISHSKHPRAGVRRRIHITAPRHINISRVEAA